MAICLPQFHSQHFLVHLHQFVQYPFHLIFTLACYIGQIIHEMIILGLRLDIEGYLLQQQLYPHTILILNTQINRFLPPLVSNPRISPILQQQPYQHPLHFPILARPNLRTLFPPLFIVIPLPYGTHQM